MISNIIDNFLGAINFICHAGILFNMLRYRRFSLAKITVDRLDKKTDAVYGFLEIRQHLKAHGVRLFGYGFNSKYLYIYVAKSQRRWVMHLLNDKMHSNEIRGVKRRWAEQ